MYIVINKALLPNEYQGPDMCICAARARAYNNAVMRIDVCYLWDLGVTGNLTDRSFKDGHRRPKLLL